MGYSHALWLGLSGFVAVLVPVVPAQAGRAATAYLVLEEETSWQPIWRDEVAELLEHAALEELTKSGLLNLQKVKKAEFGTAPTAFALRITGRFVPESETHTVLLSFEGRGDVRVGSFRSAGTVVIGKIPKAKMLERIEDSVRRAARSLIVALVPALAQLEAEPERQATAAPEVKPSSWQWGDVQVPKGSGRLVDELFGKDTKKRGAALRELTATALLEAPARHILERCVLTHKEAEVRLACLVALRPLSRRELPTQRIVIEVLRKDDDARVRDEASEQMEYFTGISRAEAIQAWLERTAATGTLVGPLKALGDLPNLDATIVQCMLNVDKRPEYDRTRSGCLELVAALPYPRRRAVLWPFISELNPSAPRYLRGAGESEGSTGTDWNRAIDALVEVRCGVDPAFEEVLWKRYQRALSASAMDILCECAEPSSALAEKLVTALQSDGRNVILAGLKRLGRSDPKLSALVRDKLSELLVTGNFRKRDRAGITERDLEDVSRALNKEVAP